MQLNRVVFPAPFGPMSPMIIPGSIEKETSELAARPPKNLETCWMSSIAMGGPPTPGSRRRAARARREAADDPEDALGREQDHDHHEDAVHEQVRVREVGLDEPHDARVG